MVEEKKNEPKKRPFIAASKLLGVFVGFCSILVIVYSMVAMFVLNDLSSLSTLIGGILGVAATYIGFYISMAKAEHIEDKRNEIKLMLKDIEKDGITPEEEETIEQLNDLDSQLVEIQHSEN